MAGHWYPRCTSTTAQRRHLRFVGLEGLLLHAAGPARPARLCRPDDMCRDPTTEGRTWCWLGFGSLAFGGYVWADRGRDGQGWHSDHEGTLPRIRSHYRLPSATQVMGAVDIKLSAEQELTLEWDSSASNDTIADSTLALINGIDKSPASVKRSWPHSPVRVH